MRNTACPACGIGARKLVGGAIYPESWWNVRSILIRTACCLLHNTPSGDPTPSKADVNVTQIIVNALAGVDIPVIDHIIAAWGRKPLDSLSMGYLNLRRRTAMPSLRSCIDSEAAEIRNAVVYAINAGVIGSRSILFSKQSGRFFFKMHSLNGFGNFFYFGNNGVCFEKLETGF